MAPTNSCTCRPGDGSPRSSHRCSPTITPDRRRGPEAMPEPVADLAEIRALLAHLPGPDLDAGSAATTREAQLTKPAGALGRLEELAGWLAVWQGRPPPRLDHPAPGVVRAQHGVA